MKLYFAPLEGIGGYIYRNAQAEFFTKADKYFAPFISPAKGRRAFLSGTALRTPSPTMTVRNITVKMAREGKRISHQAQR